MLPICLLTANIIITDLLKYYDRFKTAIMGDSYVSPLANVGAYCIESDSTDVELLLQVRKLSIRKRNNAVVDIPPSLLQSTSRAPSVFEQRLSWDSFANIQTEQQERNFRRHVRMPKASFEKLLGFIKDDLQVNEEMGGLRGGAIIPELCLYCTIRWLAGGSYSDIFYFTGISKSSFYRIIWKTMVALCCCQEEALQIKFPTSVNDCENLAKGFKSISTGGCIDNCVSAVDGFLLEINAPSKKEAGNVRSFFSGHYQKYGINIQAACDHLSRFTFFAVAGPGVMGDREACRECGLYDLIEDLPGMYTVIGDCAYKPTEHMAPIYGGNQAKIVENDNFNFFASQLRIRVEMAFGLMVKKWGILQRPISIRLKSIKYFAIAIAILHNFCINERVYSAGSGRDDNTAEEETDEDIRIRAAYAETEFDEYRRNNRNRVGYSKNRERMKRKITELKLQRPRGNHSKASR